MTHQKINPLLSILIVLAVLSLSLAPAAAQSPVLPGLEPFLDEQVQTYMESERIPNAAVAVVSGGEVVYLKGFGSADLEQSLPVDPHKTLFRVGSVAKLFTWTAVMQLVEQGRLDLHADVNQYLDFEIPSRLAVPGSSQPSPVTLLHLMTHTAGFEAYWDSIFRLSPEHLLPLDEYVRLHQPARVFPPGEVAAYSNYSAALAGYIVQRVSGRPFSEYVEENIFSPLGMQHSSFRQPLPGHLASSMARSYRWVEGAYQPGDFEYMQEPEGSLSSSAADMARFMLANLQGGSADGGRLLGEQTLSLMHTPHLTRRPQQGGMALGFMEGTYNEHHTLFHGGSTMIFDSGLYLLPAAQTGFFLVYSGANHLVHTAVFQAFMDRYFPAPAAPELQVGAGALERAQAFAGEYHQNARSFTTPESITSLIMGVIQVKAESDGTLLVTHLGEANRFVELEPGVYRNLREGRTQDYFGPFQTVAFDPGPQGRMLLSADGPMTYSRAPWYASAMFTLPALVLILLLMLVSLLVWGGGLIWGLLKRRHLALQTTAGEGARAADDRAGKGAAAARWVGIGFALLALIFLLETLTGGEPHPVYLLPQAAMQPTPAFSLGDVLPWLLAALGAAALLFTILAWAGRYWRLGGRIHYTIFTAAALLLVWILAYWNILS
jgi:CubicO group peptidase (beta-lactamase class C family)